MTIPAVWRTLTARLDDPRIVEKVGMQMVLEQERERLLGQCAKSWWHSFGLARVVCRRRASNLDHRITQLRKQVQLAKAAPRSTFGPSYAPHEIRTALRDLAGLWQRSSKIIHQICESQGIPYFHFLQPLAADKDAKPLTPEEQALTQPSVAGPQSAFLKVAQKAARHLGKQLQTQGVSFHDLTMIFAGHQRTLYVDSCCRLNPLGSEILAKEIGSTVVTALDALP